MSKKLYITSTEPRSGKSAIVLSVMQLLLRGLGRVAFFRPIINDLPEGKEDHDINLIRELYHLDQEYEDSYAFTLSEARNMVNNGDHSDLVEAILEKLHRLELNYDFVLCEGTDFLGRDTTFEFDINVDIAYNMGCPVLMVVNGDKKTAKEIISTTQLTIDALTERDVDVLSVLVNRANPEIREDILSGVVCNLDPKKDYLVGVIPDEKILGNPTITDVMKWMDAEVLYGKERLETQVDSFVVAAMQIGNYLRYITQGCLVITPGDRSDIILSTLASRQSTSYPDVAGILLTGDLQPGESVDTLIKGWTGIPVPILKAKEHTYRTSQLVNELYGRIDAEDHKKVASALGVFEKHVDTAALRERLTSRRASIMTPKMFEYRLIEKAAADRKHIVLPEGTSQRVLQAADILLRRRVVDITLLGDEQKVRTRISQLGLSLDRAQIINPQDSEYFDDYVQTYLEARKHKGVLEHVARDRMADSTYFGTMMVHKGHAHGMVSGSVTTTAQTIRPAFEFVKTIPGISIVSSVFFMCLKDRVLVYGDCAVNPNPNAAELAEIAIASAQTAQRFGIEPRVAMLSYSTGASGKGEQVDKVREAVKIAQERMPDLQLEGPMQYDAAVDPEVAATKLPDSKVAGRATICIFPDLNTGNNTYKAVQRSAKAVAVGPILQGLRRPVNDLSRGCTIADIVNTVAITAIQAQQEEE
ncbi:MAG: phosphate acetyltransferase [Desulfovibrio sp.]